MPFPTTPLSEDGAHNNNKTVITVLGGRYALIRCMADTALGKVFWACDQHQQSTNQNEDCSHVLVFTVLPALAQNTVYEQALRQVLPAYRQEHPTEPIINDDGRESDGTRWLIIRNIRGMLLAERLHELDERGIPLDETIRILHGLAEAVSHHRPSGVFGFLEPGAVLAEENSYCLLNSPLVAALRLANTGIIQRPDKLQTFYSGFISPEVAVGEAAEEADDTFSIACIAYNLLQGQAPFGSQSTLEATVRNITPPSLNKRKGNVWPALQKGLSLKRSTRPTMPSSLINNLQAPKRPALLIPAIAAGLAAVVAYAGYHVLSGLDTAEETRIAASYNSVDTTPVPSTEGSESANPTLIGEQTPPQLTDAESANSSVEQLAAEQAKAAEEAARIESIKREAEAQVAAELAASEKAADTARQKEITQLLQEARQAIQDNKLLSDDPNKPAASTYLGKILKLDPENTEARQLLSDMLNDLHDEAENQIEQHNQEKAETLLSTADKIISDFTLKDSLQRQAKLETQAEQLGYDKTRTTHYVERAERAIDYGNLTEGDDRSDSAIAYLSALLEASPNNPEGISLLKKVVRLQHNQASAELRKNSTDKARTLLDDSQKLIGEYTLDDMVEAQLDLEKRYRDVGLMGISSSTESGNTTEKQPQTREEKKPSPPATTSARRAVNPSTSVVTAPSPIPQPDDIPPGITATTSIQETMPPPDAENQTATPFDKQTGDITVSPPETPPVQEVSVPPDVPVTASPPIDDNIPTDTVNLPPVQIDPLLPEDNQAPALPETTVADTAIPEATNALQNSNGYTIPADVGSSFTPGIEGLDEYPLEEVQQSLPPIRNPAEP